MNLSYTKPIICQNGCLIRPAHDDFYLDPKTGKYTCARCAA